MIAVFRACRKRSAPALTSALAPVLGLAALALVAACQPSGLGGGPSINSSKPVPVALLVPHGSGTPGDEVVARSLENAARLAISDLKGVQIDLRVYNTGGNPDIAAKVAAEAASDGAKIILGPLYAQSANAAGLAVARRGINVLSFSNNTQIAGGNVFVLGPTFENTADRLARYAVAQGRSPVMIVHDPDVAGEAGRAAIASAVARSGGTVAATGSYELSQNGVVQAVPVLARKARDSGASAVFFTASTAGALPLLAQLLPENRVDPAQIKFIGLTRWDIPPSTLALPGLQGGWFALPDPGVSDRFERRYMAAYGEPAHPAAGLAYDGIAAIGALASQGRSDALTVSGLTQPSGFVGVNGVFRLRSDGTNERALAVAEIRDNQVTVIDPAPRSFGGAGF
ncbi:penicillin-binding protein activator [Rhodovulum sulfidophilum]|uniref:Penicillin-binding protein activator n=1 Tax=Rhodovulum visakhapatnamense TaxID=364297 RepID=A0ABS1RCG8_9RHOB|nr:penicillin-binding protein activator [Rhodovulum visakhapatnamense]MBL3568684.1 penicillin-binding protein activator [Rhodovulum visakhapatnamense]MBL3577205.1 penicillin-binding protein activator [Rhodovulum visakhapatnamense]OLS45759.1 penicillin-binding protein activator [Rhodovulum sulfidophilum]